MYSIYSAALNHVMLTYKSCASEKRSPPFEILSQGFKAYSESISGLICESSGSMMNAVGCRGSQSKETDE